MSSKFYVGMDLTGFEDHSVQRPVSRVTLRVDAERVLTAGDNTGSELAADCPHATQAMVNAILAQVQGFQYQMYEASDINIDPSMELGDGITACRTYSVISRVNDDGSGFPSASAPGQAELEDEYPAGGPMTQIINRKLAETRSSISKTAEEIRLEVEKVNGDLVELSSSFSVELGKITGSIQDTNGNLSRLEQSLKSITLSVSNGSTSSTIKLLADGAVISSQNITMDGLVTYTGLSSGTTTIDGACIKTGTIDANRLNLTGKITFSDLNTATQNAINSASTTASSALSAANSAANTVSQWVYSGTTYIDGSKIMADTIIASKLKGGVVELMNASGNISAKISLNGTYSDTTGRMLLSSYLVATTGMFNPRSTIYLGDFENNNYNGYITAHGNLAIVGSNGNKVELAYAGSEGSGSTYQDLVTVGYDTVTFPYNGSHTVHCYNNLDMHNYSVLNTSDERLKTNIEPADVDALSVVKSIGTYSFDWIEDGRHEKMGFIAQQLEAEASPDFVAVSEADGHYSTREMKMIPYLVKAVQQLAERLDVLDGTGTARRMARRGPWTPAVYTDDEKESYAASLQPDNVVSEPEQPEPVLLPV